MYLPIWLVTFLFGRQAVETAIAEGEWKSRTICRRGVILRSVDIDMDEDWELDLVPAN